MGKAGIVFRKDGATGFLLLTVAKSVAARCCIVWLWVLHVGMLLDAFGGSGSGCFFESPRAVALLVCMLYISTSISTIQFANVFQMSLAGRHNSTCKKLGQTDAD